MKIVNLVQNTPEWLEWRKSGLGGSDAPIVFGNSPYRTPRQLFLEKRGLPQPQDDADKSFIFSQGHRAEAMMRKQFQDLVGVEMKKVCGEHDEFSHIRASLDGLDPGKGMLEAKLVGKDVLAMAKNHGEIPDHHYTQMQHQFAVTGADIGQWFGHDGSKEGALIEVRPNARYIKKLLDAEHAFWERLSRGEMPELTERDYLVPEDESLLQELRDAKEWMENAKAAFEALKERAIAQYGHPKIAGGGVKIVRSVRMGSVDYKKLPKVQKLTAAYLDRFRGKESVSWTVTVDKVKVKESVDG